MGERSDLSELEILITCWGFYEGVGDYPPFQELGQRYSQNLVRRKMNQLEAQGLLTYEPDIQTARTTEAGLVRLRELGRAAGYGSTNGRNGHG